METEKTASEILKEAKELLSHGWVQGTFYRCGNDGVDRYCALGAINTVASGTAIASMDPGPEKSKAIKLLEASLPIIPSTARRWPFIDGWNDHPKTTQSEVLSVFNQAILKAEQKVSP